MSKTASATCPVCDETFFYEVRPGTRPKYCSPQHSWKVGAARQKARNAAAAERWCPRGEHTVPASDFAGPTSPYCKPCMAEWTRTDRKKPERTPDYTRRERMRNYGITQEQFEAIFEAQGRRCKICSRTEPEGKGASGWHLDHDHACCPARKRSCGKCIRGILCSNCNVGIGNLMDDPAIVRAALDYLVAYQARRGAEDHGNSMSEIGAATTASLQGIALFAETAPRAEIADGRGERAAADCQPRRDLVRVPRVGPIVALLRENPPV